MATMSIYNRNRPKSEDGYLYYIGVNNEKKTGAVIKLKDDYSCCDAEIDGVTYRLLAVCYPNTSEDVAYDDADEIIRGHFAAIKSVEDFGCAYYTLRRGELIRLR